MIENISLIGSKQDLIDVLESHIAYLEASGYDNSSPYHSHPELNICREFLMQLDETSSFLNS